jgi:hypothetical protein
LAPPHHPYDFELPKSTEQGRLFGALCTALSEAGVPNVDGKRDGLGKRLERARKYLMLVALMGTWVLNCVPEVMVTRVSTSRALLCWGSLHRRWNAVGA